MLQYFSTMANFTMVIFCLIFVCTLSLQKESTNSIVSNNKNYQLKIILYYNGSNDINLTFVDTAWKQLIFKYNKSNVISFGQVDIYKNKYFNDYIFESTPTLYVTIHDLNLIYKYNGQLTFNDIEHFMMVLGSLIT